MEALLPVFVYGTLKRGDRNHSVIEPFVASIQPAGVRGIMHELHGGFPGAVPGDGFIRGELVHLDPDRYGEAVARLDELEGATGSPGALYRRECVTVIKGGMDVEAWIYWYNRRPYGAVIEVW